MIGSPYSKKPRRGWIIDTFVGPATVLEVRKGGLIILVQDRLTRYHTLERHADGWWWVLDKDPVKS